MDLWGLLKTNTLFRNDQTSSHHNFVHKWQMWGVYTTHRLFGNKTKMTKFFSLRSISMADKSWKQRKRKSLKKYFAFSKMGITHYWGRITDQNVWVICIWASRLLFLQSDWSVILSFLTSKGRYKFALCPHLLTIKNSGSYNDIFII